MGASALAPAAALRSVLSGLSGRIFRTRLIAARVAAIGYAVAHRASLTAPALTTSGSSGGLDAARVLATQRTTLGTLPGSVAKIAVDATIAFLPLHAAFAVAPIPGGGPIVAAAPLEGRAATAIWRDALDASAILAAHGVALVPVTAAHRAVTV